MVEVRVRKVFNQDYNGDRLEFRFRSDRISSLMIRSDRIWSWMRAYALRLELSLVRAYALRLELRVGQVVGVERDIGGGRNIGMRGNQTTLLRTPTPPHIGVRGRVGLCLCLCLCLYLGWA